MKPIPAQTMEEMKGNNANGAAISALTNGAANEDGVHAIVPTRGELAELAKHWAAEAIRDQFLIFWGMGCGGSDWRRICNYWGRVGEIAQVLGKNETEQAVGEAWDEASRCWDPNDWIVFRYGNSEEAHAYQDNGGQCFLDFEPGVAEGIASKVIERVFRDGSPGNQEALIKEELRRCAGQLKADCPHHVIEIFGIHFPAAVKPIVLSAGIADPDPGGRANTNTFYKNLTIEQGKAILGTLQEAVRQGWKADESR
jgi:hypothetical protein